MSIIIFAILVLIVFALLCWAVSLLPIPAPFNNVIQALLIVLAAVLIAQRAGVF